MVRRRVSDEGGDREGLIRILSDIQSGASITKKELFVAEHRVLSEGHSVYTTTLKKATNNLTT
jgi:hypothetical protein